MRVLYHFCCCQSHSSAEKYKIIVSGSDINPIFCLRTVSFDVPPQEVLTRDSVTVTVDAVVYYRVSNPTMVS